MASGVLGTANVGALTNTIVYTVPAGKVATVNINICNRNSGVAKVRLALAATGTPSSAEYIEYDCSIAGNGVLERTGFVLDAAKNIVVYSYTANVSVVIHGFEE